MIFINIFKRDFANIFLNPVLLLVNSIFPVLMVLVLGYLSGSNYGSQGVTSYDYYGITILLFSILNVSMTASNSFMEKSLKLSNLRIMFSPINTSYIYVSKILATSAFTSLCYFLYALICKFFFQVNFGYHNTPYIFIIMLLFNLLSSSLGVLFCCIFKGEDLANTILSPLNNIFAILGGIFFQLDGFGKGIGVISNISPIKWIAKISFQIIYDSDLSSFLPLCLILIIISLLLILFCKFTFKMEDYV